MSLKLVSFDICPYALRVASALNFKKLQYEIEFIDLQNQPEWFVQASPLQKVPILIIDGTRVLFESNVILDYIDSISPPSFQPTDPYERALTRAKQEFAGEVLSQVQRLVHSKTKEEYEGVVADFRWYFDKLSPWIQHKFLLGDEPSLADFSFAPIFTTLKAIQPFLKEDLLSKHPNIRQYADNLIALEAVQKAIVPQYQEIVNQLIKKVNGYIAKQE